MKYELITDVYKQGLITQRLELTKEVNGYDSSEVLMSWIFNTRETQIRDALIALGWIPPNLSNPI